MCAASIPTKHTATSEAPLRLDKRPPAGDKAIARRWVDAKIQLGQFRVLLSQVAPNGNTYEFVFDGTEKTWPAMATIKEAGFIEFSKKLNITLAHPDKPDKELKAWGRLVV